MTLQEPRSSSRLHWLDLLRFLAAFAVVLVHARGHALVEFGALPADQRSPLVFAFFALTRVGNEAVTVFFVLSGFLVGGKAIERIGNGSFRFADYAIDRVTRIYVPLVPALALSAVVAGFIGEDRSIASFFGNLAGLQGIATEPFGLNRPLWSLSYEIWFYVLAGAVGVAAAYRGMHAVAAIAIVSVACIFTKLSPTFLFCWIIGAVAYVRRPRRSSFLGWIAALILIAYGTIGVEIGMVSDSVKGLAIAAYVPSWDVSHIVLSTGTALLVQQLVVSEPKRRLAKAIDHVGTPLGAFSYTLYLVHYPIIRAIVPLVGERMPRIDLRSIGYLALLTVASVAGAVVMYWLFERHTASVRRWIKGRWKFSPGGSRMDSPG
jgi:peptidoglycan/LPS O-acetylase OafA/YrhL